MQSRKDLSTKKTSANQQAKDDSQPKSEHFEDYNFKNYRELLTRYVSNKKRLFMQGRAIFLGLSPHRLIYLNNKVKEAIDLNKIFTIRGYYPSVRYKLLRDGWVEKFDENIKPITDLTVDIDLTKFYPDSAPYIEPDNLRAEEIVEQYHEQQYMSKQLENRSPDLLFALKRSLIDFRLVDENMVVSYFPRCSFCTKLGLNVTLENTCTFGQEDFFLKYPRGYNMVNELSMQLFIYDFRITACFSLMRFLVRNIERNIEIFTSTGSIPTNIIDFAQEECQRHMRVLQFSNVDDGDVYNRYEVEEPEAKTKEWNDFCDNVIYLTNRSFDFEWANAEKIKSFYQEAKNLLTNYRVLSDQDTFDGIYNIWVLKPVANCSGHGIRLFRRLSDIVKAIGPLKNLQHTRHVIQKYIENPLLIHGVKFDLRVWYLVTSVFPLRVWVYNEGYVRFCSKPYSGIALDETRHLTNVRVQKQYRHLRDPSYLPEELMWDFAQFQNFLKLTKKPDQWQKIMTSIEKAIINVMRTAQGLNYIQSRRNSFQLFGADFLINEHYEPCLIEVNNGPGLAPTTSIIAKKTTQLLTDIIKVITLDKSSHRTSHPDTGLFKLVCREDANYEHIRNNDEIDDALQVKSLDLNKYKAKKKDQRFQKHPKNTATVIKLRPGGKMR